MSIIYSDNKKDLPCDQLQRLFFLSGWSDRETPVMENFNIGFINSTLVISAWEGERLVGAVRVLSDRVFRSVIYDLIVEPAYQGKGVGRTLVMRCMEHFPKSEWLVFTTKEISGYYEKLGFQISKETFLSIPCQLFTVNQETVEIP